MSIDAVFAQFFDNIHDPRQHAKIYYPFYDVLFLTVCAVIGGAEGWEDIEDFGDFSFYFSPKISNFRNGNQCFFSGEFFGISRDVFFLEVFKKIRLEKLSLQYEVQQINHFRDFNFF